MGRYVLIGFLTCHSEYRWWFGHSAVMAITVREMWRFTLNGRTLTAAKRPAAVLLTFSVMLLCGRTLCQRPTHTTNRNSIESRKSQSQAIIQIPSSDESQNLLRTGEFINHKAMGNAQRRVPRVGIDRGKWTLTAKQYDMNRLSTER